MTEDIDWAAIADWLEGQAEAYAPAITQALAELGEPAPRTILDIGSGPGVVSGQLATAFPGATVTAVDGTPELLERAADRAGRRGFALQTVTAQFPEGLTGLEPADLVWSGQVVHHVGDQQDALNRLAALVNPGGTLAIIEGGLTTRWLPRDCGIGRPGLQERLDVLRTERFNTMRAELPGSVPVVEDWPAMLRTAGLGEARSKTFLIDHPAPLSEELRKVVRSGFERERNGFAEDLGAEDRATLDRLLDPDEELGIDRRPDLFLLTAKTVHFARRP
ncbi:class I SAM-dependent methyltransferase [Sciscionella sediminilitoris]|uniref:class I SAM-dependent methyltransferase n=1 Tax=Sciscionella sediminilitoris TaxID=1445613 RepID=UPI0004DEDCE4|nr:class I SAM-dependent methyltransferase [Sciscionella sp. SE31]